MIKVKGNVILAGDNDFGNVILQAKGDTAIMRTIGAKSITGENMVMSRAEAVEFFEAALKLLRTP